MNEQRRKALEDALKLIDVLGVHTENLSAYDRERMQRDVTNRGLDDVRAQIITALRGE